MTCIVALTDGERVLIGGDSAGTNGHELRLRTDAKVFRAGPYGLGFTSSFRMGQILRYETELPEPPTNTDAEELERFMVTEFVETVRQAFSDKGFAKTARYASPALPGLTEEGQAIGGTFLVGVAGQVFEIMNDFQVSRPSRPYSAVGKGALVALGALHALEDGEMSLRERGEAALVASEAYCSYVREPFRFVEV